MGPKMDISLDHMTMHDRGYGDENDLSDRLLLSKNKKNNKRT